MIEVYHMKHDMDRDERWSVSYGDTQKKAAKELFAAGRYEKVAEVDTDDLELAFQLTNNIDTSWSMEPDPRVRLTAPLHVANGEMYGRKSSEMGDIFIMGGVQYVTAMTGFEPL